MWLPYKILFVILNFLVLPLNTLFILMLCLYKLIVCLFAKIFQDFVCVIPGPCTVFLPDHIWDRPHSSIIAGVELNRNPSEIEVEDIFQRVYDYKDSEGKRFYSELGYCLVRYGGYGFWKKVPNFDIRDRIEMHVSKVRVERDVEGEDNVSSAGSRIHEEPLTSVVEGMLRQPYKVDQPLWDVFLIHDYNRTPNRTLALLRFHHVLADGMSFVKFFFALTGYNKLPETLPKPTTSMQIWDRLSSSVLSQVSTVLTLSTVGIVNYLHDVLFEQDKHAIHFNDKGKLQLTGNWICSLGKKLDIRDMKQASKSYGCSVTHIILAGIGAGIERYFHKYHNNDIPEGIHYIVPLPIPGHPDMRLTNHWSFSKVNAKFGIGSTGDKLAYFQGETKRCAESTLTIVTALIFQHISGLLPTPLADLLGRVRATFTVLLSNVVGPQDNRLIGESNILDMFFFMPISQESMALGAGVISCNGTIRVCLTGDLGCIPDRSHLDDLGMMIYDELLEICNSRKNIV